MIEVATIEDYARLNSKVDDLALMVELLNYAISAPQNMTVQMIADSERVSVSHLYCGGAYLLPRFGESAFPTGPKRWPTKEYRDWRKLSPTTRYDMWLKHLEAAL